MTRRSASSESCCSSDAVVELGEEDGERFLDGGSAELLHQGDQRVPIDARVFDGRFDNARRLFVRRRIGGEI